MDYKEMMDYEKLIKALTCQGAEGEPDNLGCSNRECKYRDTDGGCNLVSLELDAAVAILSLLKRAQKAEREREVLLQYRTPESPHPDGDTSIEACPMCGSKRHLYNKDGNRNRYCGECGKMIDWTEYTEE